MKKVVTARLPVTLVNQLDRLVRQGMFDNRSEAIRKLLKKQMQRLDTVLDLDILQDLKEPQIAEEDLLQIGDLFEQPVWKRIREGRERR